MQFVLFTDNIADLSIREACRAAKKASFDGLDLTVRPEGHVLPENARTGLPAAQTIADEENFAIPMISTAITDADEPYAEDIIQAAHFRIPAIKIGYARYQPFGTLARQLDDARRKLEGIVKLASRYHVRPCLHVHSGPVLANPTVIYQLLKDYSPTEVSAYADPMHMTLEGGEAGWEMTLDLIAPWVALVGVKNFAFEPAGRGEDGQQRFSWRFVPLADGMAPLSRFFSRLKEIGYDGVVSLHSEYKGGRTWRKLTTDELLTQSAEDLRFLKQIIARL